MYVEQNPIIPMLLFIELHPSSSCARSTNSSHDDESLMRFEEADALYPLVAQRAERKQVSAGFSGLFILFMTFGRVNLKYVC